MKNFNAHSSFCEQALRPYVYNLTSSYADKRNEAAMATISVCMLILAAAFFVTNLFSRFSDISAYLRPSVRFCLKVALSIFLPIMSYLFSEAREGGAAAGELPLRARMILGWMLLVELLRKKVEAIRVTAGMKGYSATVERAVRVAWLGYLVFYNVRSVGKRALYGSLWVLVAAKLVKRFVGLEVAKRSFAHGKNAQLIASYMAHLFPSEPHASSSNAQELRGSELLKKCNYAVRGEQDLVGKARLEMDHSQLMGAIATADSVVTVGKIWTAAETLQAQEAQELREKKPKPKRIPKLKRLCLSFALYKLLRRRLEHFPINEDEARNCHDLIFKGLCEEETNQEANADALFQVLRDELEFLREYYYSIYPVMFASPFFFFANYVLSPIILFALCIFMVMLCSNGDVSYAYWSFFNENFPMTIGLMRMFGCILTRITKSAPDLFTAVDICISFLLVLSFVYEEVWEWVLIAHSNWFIVSLGCSYTSKPKSPICRWLLGRVIHLILRSRRGLSKLDLRFKQFSMLQSCRVSPWPQHVPVPVEAKKYIMLCMCRDRKSPIVLSEELCKLLRLLQLGRELPWACQSSSVAEIILTWHIATEFLEVKCPLQQQTTQGPQGLVAKELSRYCAYLVAFRPELLSDDKDIPEQAYKDMKEELKQVMGGCWGYYFFEQQIRCDKLMEIVDKQKNEELTKAAVDHPKEAETALRKGARLGKLLMDKAMVDNAAREHLWMMLDDLWTELVVCAAATSSERHVEAHKKALEHRGEFINKLWALAIHTGLDYKPVDTPPACASTSSCV